MSFRCDLHAHSTASDGRLRPAELVEEAARRRVDVVALTDHDTVAGLPEAAERATQLGVHFVPGIEISAVERGGEVEIHVLGLGIDWQATSLCDLANEAHAARAGRAQRMVEQLRSRGVDIEFADVEAAADGATIGRPHVARALVERGVVDDVEQAFARWLRRGRPGYVQREAPTPAQAIARIHAAGGIASLAHPPRSRGADGPGGLQAFVERCSAAGLDGLEVVHPAHRPGQMRKLRRACRELDLCETGGSDFHEPDTGIILGRGRGRSGSDLGRRLWEGVEARLERRRASGENRP